VHHKAKPSVIAKLIRRSNIVTLTKALTTAKKLKNKTALRIINKKIKSLKR